VYFGKRRIEPEDNAVVAWLIVCQATLVLPAMRKVPCRFRGGVRLDSAIVFLGPLFFWVGRHDIPFVGKSDASMNPNEVLRIVDAIHRDKKIDKEIVFQAIEAALVSAAKKHYGDESEILISIDREDGSISGSIDAEQLDPEETVGRVGAQTAKQVIIQKIREAERDALYNEYDEMIGQMLGGTVQRNDGGAATVSLGNVEAILPRSEQIPGETHHAGERIRATVFEVRKQGSRVKVLLSRTRPALVERLFEQEIPEIADGVISVRALSREPGYRSKVAVSSSDPRVDCVGACVGVRGNRIKNIVDELSGERIDIVRYNDDPQVLIANSLQPAEIDEVILCQMLGRAIVLVREDQLSLAIGRRGQNVRLGSKLCGWDIEIMTREELEEQIERAVLAFSSMEGVPEEVAEALVGEGYLSYDDLSVIEPDALMEMSGLSEQQVQEITDLAERKAEEAERAAATQRRRQREVDAAEKAAEAAGIEEAEVEVDTPAPDEAEAAQPAEADNVQDESVDSPAEDTSDSEPSDADEPAVVGETGEADEASDAAATVNAGELEGTDGDGQEEMDGGGDPEETPPSEVATDATVDSETPSPEEPLADDAVAADTEPTPREREDTASA
jgi:N utilization substance protein A